MVPHTRRATPFRIPKCRRQRQYRSSTKRCVLSSARARAVRLHSTLVTQALRAAGQARARQAVRHACPLAPRAAHAFPGTSCCVSTRRRSRRPPPQDARSIPSRRRPRSSIANGSSRDLGRANGLRVPHEPASTRRLHVDALVSYFTANLRNTHRGAVSTSTSRSRRTAAETCAARRRDLPVRTEGHEEGAVAICAGSSSMSGGKVNNYSYMPRTVAHTPGRGLARFKTDARLPGREE
ncbi:hypothetical protein BV20DRAFT_541283 [Pilatotrama ljubarskyi]|nr:hypothetical protein BV20DRAFT_541283 [Pilatotrama ljubarskyi]